jgi:hypothetical protein
MRMKIGECDVIRSMKKMLVLLAIATGLSHAMVSSVCQTSNLTVAAFPTTLRAGYNTPALVAILNDFETVYDVSVQISFSQSQTAAVSPTVIGASDWKFQKIDKGENLTVRPTIFTPKEAAGNAYTASIVIGYKRLGYVSAYSESHTIGFYAKGRIEMTVYDFTVEPEPVSAGSVLSITASLLNTGNVPAKFASVTLLPNPILTLKPGSYSYLGEVDPDDPTPFTLEASVKQGAGEGSHTLSLKVQYEDEESIVHTFEKEVTVNIAPRQEGSPKSTQQTVIDLIRGNLPYVMVGGLAVVVVVVLLMKRQSSKNNLGLEDSHV